MVAVNATLAVVYPHMTGAGGDAFWLLHDAATGEQHVLNASGRAAMAADRSDHDGDAIAFRGPAAALTVPGAVDGWLEAHGRFGRLPLAECLGRRSTTPATASRSAPRWRASRSPRSTCCVRSRPPRPPT